MRCFFPLDPKPVVDRPIRVEGIEDNGVAAVWAEPDHDYFRFVGVAEGSAWFQENTYGNPDIWAGNVFICDNKNVKMTLIVDGQSPGQGPRLEVHNPTDAEVHATITSPPHTPLFGGMKLSADVPAGASVVLKLPKGDSIKTLRPK